MKDPLKDIHNLKNEKGQRRDEEQRRLKEYGYGRPP